MLIAYIHWFEKMNHAAHPCLCKTTRRSMFNRLLGNVKLVRYVLQLLSDYYNSFELSVRSDVRDNEVLLDISRSSNCMPTASNGMMIN
jgi:hypothetical protein